MNVDLLGHLVERLLIALFFGSIIGWQRQSHGSAAGLRTHILVCIAAALLTCIDTINPSFQGKLPAAVITGVGFLGAGTILRSDKGDSVHGLTTAASVWATAGIGIALGSAGLGTWIGSFTALLVLITLSVVYQIEETALRHVRKRSLAITLKAPDGVPDGALVSRLSAKMKHIDVAIQGMRQVKDEDKDELHLYLQLHLPDGMMPDRILTAVSSDKDVSLAQWVM
jgi:putative Mg2+ transporter-C (MgtC) family protein